MIDLGQAGFAFANHWYWRIAERTSSLTVNDIVNDLLRPTARLARDAFRLDATAVTDRTIECRIADHIATLELVPGDDRTVVERLVVDLDRELARANVEYTFVIAIARRYELRGVLVSGLDLAALALDQIVAPRRWPRASQHRP
jgi:hypothetical protein